MKTPTKFVKPLTDDQREQLHAIMKSTAPQRTRMRTHAGLLSERRYSLAQIADSYQVDRDRVSQGLEWGKRSRGLGWAMIRVADGPPSLRKRNAKRHARCPCTTPARSRQA